MFPMRNLKRSLFFVDYFYHWLLKHFLYLKKIGQDFIQGLYCDKNYKVF